MRHRLDASGLLWLAVATISVEIWVTYARLPASELYNVSGTGLQGGASRVLMFLNFPVALVAVAIVLELFDRLPRRLRPVALVSVALCLVVVVPGIVRQSDLDARPINALAAIGVALAFALWLAAEPRQAIAFGARGDRLRVGIGVVCFLAALPWLAAELGFYLDPVPLLGWIFRTGTPYQGVPSVHHGHHHGIDGLLLVACSLLLSRSLPVLRAGAARLVLSLYLALMLPYGIANAINDDWLEQIVKRGWISWQFPSVLTPQPSLAWLGIVVAAAAVWLIAYRPVKP